MKFLFFSLLFLVSGLVYGQQPVDTMNTIVIHKDPRVDVLVKKQATVNASIKIAGSRTARGYRLLVVNTNKRDEATAAKTKVYTHFPELKAYLVYQTPYFKLKAGNFRTREEAQDYQKLLSIYFPKGVMIVSDTIEVTPEKESE